MADIRLEHKESSLWVTITREERRNAITSEVLEAIAAAVKQAQSDPSIRAIVLTGAGDRAFCAGADLSRGTGTFQAQADEPTTDFGRLARLVRSAHLPLVARVNGACVAGGMGLLCLCDIAIAADHARFGLPEVKVGVFPMQVLVYLRATMHARHINELCLTGELITAARAAEIGLVNTVVPAAELDAHIDALLAKLMAASPVATKRGKQVIAAMETMGFEQALSFAEAQIALASASSDAREGIAAFNEKRKPAWAPGQGA
jgi:enoyl-CoA hydratase/carnithine racemase